MKWNLQKEVKTGSISCTGVVTSKFQVLLFITFNCPMSHIQCFSLSLSLSLYIYIYIIFFCEHQLFLRLDWAYCSSTFWVSQFFYFILFFLARMNSNRIVHAHGFYVQESKCTFHALFTSDLWDPQPLYFEKKVKNGSHSTIHTFKNYFATIFFVFSFQQIKLYPNGS